MALTADGWPQPVSALTISDSPKLVIAGEQLGARLTTKIQLSEQNVTPCSKRSKPYSFFFIYVLFNTAQKSHK